VVEKSRVEQLEEFVKAKPTDALSRYMFAMELKKLGRNDDSLREFDALHDKNAEYVPAYLMHGQLLNTLGRPDDARKVLERGIAIASKVGNTHALGEMSELLESLS
jgi:tetratricopeptide (TPR) repeat protein